MTAVTPRLEAVETGFPRHRHPAWPQIQASSRQWVVDQRLLEADMASTHADALRYTDLVCEYYLDAPTTVVSAIADFSTWFFLWDDYHQVAMSRRWDDRWRRLGERLRATVDDPQRHLRDSEPLVSALADTLVRIFSFGSTEWAVRFRTHAHAFLHGYNQEYRDRIAGAIPTVSEYIALRRLTFGCWTWIDLMEPAAQYELPDWVRDNSSFRSAALASQDYAAWCNDLYSLPKELAAGETHNLGISLIHHHGFTLDQARLELRDRLYGRISDFLCAEDEVAAMRATMPPRLRTAVGSCLFNMRNWIPAVYWFHQESGRYQIDEWADPSQPPYVPHHPVDPDGDFPGQADGDAR